LVARRQELRTGRAATAPEAPVGEPTPYEQAQFERARFEQGQYEPEPFEEPYQVDEESFQVEPTETDEIDEVEEVEEVVDDEPVVQARSEDELAALGRLRELVDEQSGRLETRVKQIQDSVEIRRLVVAILRADEKEQ
jgi:hypothetical protein